MASVVQRVAVAAVLAVENAVVTLDLVNKPVKVLDVLGEQFVMESYWVAKVALIFRERQLARELLQLAVGMVLTAKEHYIVAHKPTHKIVVLMTVAGQPVAADMLVQSWVLSQPARMVVALGMVKQLNADLLQPARYSA